MSSRQSRMFSDISGDGPHHNDTSGWTLVHDQIRAVIAEALFQASSVRADDQAATKRLVAWWLSFSRSFEHHMRTEDDRIWPALVSADPQRTADLERLTREHREIVSLLAAVDLAVTALLEQLRPERFESCRITLLARLRAFEPVVTRHLAQEEASAFTIGCDAVHPEEWSRIERDMVKGLGLRDVATLVPRVLEQADSAGRAKMLGRLPWPMRFVVVRVFEPRYRRTRAALPVARAALSAARLDRDGGVAD